MPLVSFGAAAGIFLLLVAMGSASNAQNSSSPGEAEASNVSYANGSTPAPQPQQQAAKPVLKLADQTVNLPAGVPTGAGSLILTVDGSGIPIGKKPEVVDIGHPESFQVRIEESKLQLLKSATGSQVWLIPVSVENLKEIGPQQRYLSVKYAGASETLAYTVDNAIPANFSWKVTGPPATAIAWSGKKRLPLTIAIGGSVPATNLRLAQRLLREPDTAVTAEFQLCQNAEGVCIAPDMLPAGRSTTVYLGQASDAPLSPGAYSGALAVVAAEQLQGEAFEIAIDVTSAGAKWIGFGALVLGVLLSWLVTVHMRHTIVRLKFKRVAAVLRLRIERLVARLGQVPAAFRVATDAQLSDMRTQLAEDKLIERDLMPGLWPSLSGDSDAVVGSFQEFAKAMDVRIGKFDIIADTGLVPIAEMLADSPESKPVKDALKAVDDKAKTVDATQAADLLAAVSQLAASASGGAQDAQGAPSESRNVDRLSFQIESINLVGWLILMLTTILIGALVLLVSDNAFGQPRDYLICLLWGLGIPVAGGQLAQLNAGSALTAFSITKPA